MQRRTSQDPLWSPRDAEAAEAAEASEDGRKVSSRPADAPALLDVVSSRWFFEAFPAPLLVVASDGAIASSNKEASVLMGVPSDRLVGRMATDYLMLDEGEDGWRRARETLRGLRDLPGEVHASSARVPVRVSMSPLSGDADGLLVLLRSASRDEAVIRSLRDVAQRAAQSAAGLASMGEATTRKAQRIRGAMQGIADGTQVQARKVEETVEVIKDLAKNIDQISSHAVSASSRIQAQAVTAREGTEVANMALGRLSKIVEDVHTTAKNVHELAAHVEQVEKILDFVDEVARETNLVSLNAAIEAARAGDSGRAFSAVADEVKRLAAHTREALVDTARLIDAAKVEAAAVERDADARVDEVTASAQHIREALTRFESVANDILESSELIGSISEATVAQKRSAGAIVAAIDEVAGVAEEATRSTEEAHLMADEVTSSMQALTQMGHDLTGIASSLRGTLERFFQARGHQAANGSVDEDREGES